MFLQAAIFITKQQTKSYPTATTTSETDSHTFAQQTQAKHANRQ
jgi:hypothetical protein